MLRQVQAIETTRADEDFSIPMLDSVVPNYRFIFTAEEHWLKVNTRVQGLFLPYLHQQAGVRNLVVEGGYAYGWMINRFLETGDSLYLMRALYDPPTCPRNQARFFQDLYAYNQEQPETNRIRVVGIDYEKSGHLAIECLFHILPAKPLTAGVRDKVRELMEMYVMEYEEREKELKRFFRQWYKEVQERKRAYRRYWGDEFPVFEMILENTLQGFESPLLREFVYAYGDQKKREERMYDNFRLLFKMGKFNPGGFYAQFGGIHTELNPGINWGYKTLAQRLNEERYSPVYQQVLTISKYFRRLGRIYEKFPEEELFRNVMDEIGFDRRQEIVICRLEGNEDLFPTISQDFQFILIIDEDMELERCE
ncbi:MAG: hypothetical protein AAFP92_13620 [Bacteroidota bacterium]